MPGSSCSALHGVNPNFKKIKDEGIFWEQKKYKSCLFFDVTAVTAVVPSKQVWNST